MAASLQAAGRQQPVGVVDDRPQREDHVAGLGGQPARRRQLGQPGVGVAEVDEGAAQGGAGVGLLGVGTDLAGDGDRLLGQLPAPPRSGPPSRRYSASEPSTRARSADGSGGTSRTACCWSSSAAGVAEPAQAAGQLLVQQPGPPRLARLIDQR